MDAPAVVVDIGNTRVKVAPVDKSGVVGEMTWVPTTDQGAWEDALEPTGILRREGAWAVSSVNPVATLALKALLARRKIHDVRWYTSAADVPQPSELKHPERAGADRALAVLAAVAFRPYPRPCVVVMAGTAVTVEAVDERGIWLGGVIAPGLGVLAKALSSSTAQLPNVAIDPSDQPPWAVETEWAIAGGLAGMWHGGVRQLVRNQCLRLGHERVWTLWSGGDSEPLARTAEGPNNQFISNLVLHGLFRAAQPRRAGGEP